MSDTLDMDTVEPAEAVATDLNLTVASIRCYRKASRRRSGFRVL